MKSIRHHLLACALVLAAAPAAWAQAGSAAQDRYNQETARCNSGQSSQDRATCLREAGAALDESKRGGLNTSGANLSQNATDRCNAQPAADRADCIKRIMGAGSTAGGTTSTSGSVEGGGVIRETVTPVK